MKRFTKNVIALLVLSLILSIVPAAFAAEYKAEPGQTVKVVFEVKEISGIDGTITVDDPNGIVASAEIDKIESAMVNRIGDDKKTFFCYGSDPVTWKLTYIVKLKSGLAEGATCTVTANYAVTDKDYNFVEDLSQSHTIVVDLPDPTEPSQPTQPTQPSQPTQPTQPSQPTQPTQPSQPTQPTQPKPTEPKPTEPKPTQPAATVDTAKLKEQISDAQELDSSKYSAESWAKLQDALKKAQDALKSKDQSVIDAAAAALEKAINELVALDRSALEAAIAKVEKFLSEDTIGSKAKELIDTLEKAKELLNSQDQAKMDEAAGLLEQLLDELQKAILDLTKVEEIIKEIEKIVEVAPKDPYCNISMHYVWPILFFISLALNVGFIVLIIVYFARKKKNQTDDTPLVDYDIADDVAGVDDAGAETAE